MNRKLKINFFHKKHFAARTAAVIVAVILMSFALSWLFWIDMGADPYTVMNRAIAARLGMSIGNWQLILNTALFILVLIFGGSNIGIGTLVNMFWSDMSSTFSPAYGTGLCRKRRLHRAPHAC